MKKVISAVIVCVMMLSAAAVFADGADIVINGESVVIGEGMGNVVEENGTVFVPVRFVLERLGFEVSWDAAEKELVFGRNEAGDIMLLQIGGTHLIYKGVDGRDVNIVMDTVPFLNAEEGRTYISLDSLAEALGYTAEYSEETEIVSLTKAAE